MNIPRFLFVIGMGRGVAAHPVWPDVHQAFAGELNEDGSWVAWRLVGANHRELGRSPSVFPDLIHARGHAAMVGERVKDADAHILTVPHTTTWRWRLMCGETPVAASSRGYARHRECADNASAFAAASVIAEIA